MHIKVDQVTLNLVAGYAIKQGEKLKIRAKTLQVLQYLIDHKDEIVTKDLLLSTIWNDVVVQEQVLVQSIKEIRAIVGSDAIKTYPKKGYQWVAPISPIVSKSNKTKQKIAISLAILFSLIVVIALYFNQNESKKLTVGFLPIENTIPDAAHDWVPTKGSEHLRELMAKYHHVDVVSSDKLDTLRKQVDVDVLVYTRLAGYPEDFQLDYILYLPHGTERGVEFSNDIDQLLSKLTTNLAKRFNIAPSVTDALHSDFSHEALSRGIELYLNREYSSAQVFFASALHDNPSLLTARRFLAACKVNLDQQTNAKQLLVTNINQAQSQSDHKEQIRSQQMLAALLINQQSAGDHTKAEQHLQQVIQLSKQHNIPMFTAYALEELGKSKRLQQDFLAAEQFLQQALQYHQGIANNYSQTTALIELALTASAQKQIKRANHYVQQAQHIAKTHGAITNQVAILMAQATIAKQQGQIEQSTQFAHQALALATEADNELLVARINAWLENRYYYEVH